MELSQRGMVQLMPADFEVPLFAVERLRGVVVKTPDGVDNGLGATHWSCEPHGVSAGDVRPSFMETALVEEYHLELSDVMLFDIARIARAAPCHERDGRADEERHGTQPGP